ncbi:SMI1/KNR4 family protein [Laceyella tengchongensis]
MKWEKSKTPATEVTISDVEQCLGIKFPDDYREVAKQSHGTQPTPYILKFDEGELIFGNLLSYDKDSPIYFEKVYSWVKGNLPEKVIPFARDPFGNYHCFDYREGGEPTIVN